MNMIKICHFAIKNLLKLLRKLSSLSDRNNQLRYIKQNNGWKHVNPIFMIAINLSKFKTIATTKTKTPSDYRL